MYLEAPLSTYHLTQEMVLVERHDTMEKVVSNLDAKHLHSLQTTYEIEAIPITEYVASSPSSTCMPISCCCNLKKVDLSVVMCPEAPLSTYHPTQEMVLVERHHEEGCFQFGCKLFNSYKSFCTPYKLLMLLLLTLPLLLKTLRSIMVFLVALKELHMGRIFLPLVRRTQVFLLVLLTPPKSSFLASLPYPPNEDKDLNILIYGY